MITSTFMQSETSSNREKEMGRLQLRPRRLWIWTRFRLLKTTHTHIWLLIVTCSIVFLLSILVLILFATSGSSRRQPGKLVRPFAKRKVTDPPTPSLKREKSNIDKTIVYQDYNYLDPRTLTHQSRKYSNGVQVLYRLPNRTATVGLLLIFHGCGRSANDWFHTIERQRIIGAAVDLGYGCLAFQATDEENRCWSSHSDVYENQDATMVTNGLNGFFAEHPQLGNLPLFSFGASSGGIFSSIFAVNQKYKIRGQILFISIIAPEILDLHVKKNFYPPTAWIYMPRDKEFASEARISASIKPFTNENIPHQTYQIGPVPVTPTTFHERIPTITRDVSQYIFYRFQQNKWLDGENFLKYNPRRTSSWKTFLYPSTINMTDATLVMKTLKKHEPLMPDLLNTLYGEHEISYEHSYEALQWLLDTYNQGNRIQNSRK